MVDLPHRNRPDQKSVLSYRHSGQAWSIDISGLDQPAERATDRSDRAVISATQGAFACLVGSGKLDVNHGG